MLYIPPTQNPFLVQSMSMLGNMMSAYMAHGYRQEELKQAQEIKDQESARDLETKMVLGGYRPADESTEAPPDRKFTLPAIGSQPAKTWVKPEPKMPLMGFMKLPDGRSLPIMIDENNKATPITEAIKDNSKQPSADLQGFAAWLVDHPNGNFTQYKEWDANLKKQATPSMGMSYNPETGEFSFTQGEGASGMQGGVKLTPASTNKAQEAVFDIDKSLQNIQNISSLYKPEYQTTASKLQNWISAGKEKFGMQLDEVEKKDLQDYANYRKASVGLYADEIQKGGGKTLTPFEVKIYGGKLPNPGTGMVNGVFDGDSPSEYEAGMKQMYSTLMKSKARYMWYQAQGMGKEFQAAIKKNLPPEKAGLVSLDKMDEIINNRAAQIERDMRLANPAIDQKQLTDIVKKTIQKEFFGATQ